MTQLQLLPATAPLAPPLKWAGGKRWLAPRLAELYAAHRHRRLVEPFAGGLGVALSLRPRRALVADINEHLINFYLELKYGLTPASIPNAEAAYYEARSEFNYLVEEKRHRTPRAAQLFYYLNRHGFNGLCRFNRSGRFNVPYGRYLAPHYATDEDFAALKQAFERWVFVAADFSSTLVALTNSDDFVYADPPYDAGFADYSEHAFLWADQERLARALAYHRGPVAASNLATERVVELYLSLGFEIEYHAAPRRISCDGDRAPVREMLAWNNL